jgi:acetoin utilization protein AcuB
MQDMPQVRQFMTRSPKTIPASTPLSTVVRLMREYCVRHFPVEIGGTLVGVVSERNVKVALLSREGDQYRAEDVMIPAPYVVDPSTDLFTVVSAMADEKYGSAIIQEGNGKVVGILTLVDVCRALCQHLEDCHLQ